MTRHSPAPQQAPLADAGERLAQLCDVLALVEQMAGRPVEGAFTFDAAANVTGAYAEALPIVRQRFDRLLAETAAWAATGLEALTADPDTEPPRAASACFADELRRSLRRLAAMLPPKAGTARQATP